MAQPSWQRVRRASARLSRAAVAEMDALPWFRALPAQERSYVGLVVEAGLGAFTAWLRAPEAPVPTVFAAAPRELTRAVTLKQTVQLIRLAVDVVEREVPALAAPGDEQRVREAVLRYSREIAFAAADVYASAAEARGAWDARVEAGVVDALVRGAVGSLVLSRAAALGWERGAWVVAAAAPADRVVDLPALRAHTRAAGLSLLSGESTGALVLVVGGPGGAPADGVAEVARRLPDGPVVHGPVVGELADVATSVQEALAGLAAVGAWPQAPRPVAAAALLAERAVLGEAAARTRLLEDVHAPLAAAGGDLLATAAAYLEQAGSLEGAARLLVVHPNTVRYRLKRIREVVGHDPADARGALVLRLALVLGREPSL